MPTMIKMRVAIPSHLDHNTLTSGQRTHRAIHIDLQPRQPDVKPASRTGDPFPLARYDSLNEWSIANALIELAHRRSRHRVSSSHPMSGSLVVTPRSTSGPEWQFRLYGASQLLGWGPRGHQRGRMLTAGNTGVTRAIQTGLLEV